LYEFECQGQGQWWTKNEKVRHFVHELRSPRAAFSSGTILWGTFLLQFYARGKISECCLTGIRDYDRLKSYLNLYPQNEVMGMQLLPTDSQGKQCCTLFAGSLDASAEFVFKNETDANGDDVLGLARNRRGHRRRVRDALQCSVGRRR